MKAQGERQTGMQQRACQIELGTSTASCGHVHSFRSRFQRYSQDKYHWGNEKHIEAQDQAPHLQLCQSMCLMTIILPKE